MSIAHLYVSTACIHSEHGSCRNTCKFCGDPCVCPCHPGGAQAAEPLSPVDQARNVARALYAQLRSDVPVADVSAMAGDPSLFWLHGEVPPGEWRPLS